MNQLFVVMLVAALFLFGVPILSVAQEVEHNYTVGPQVTTCDSLKPDRLPASELINLIEKTKFRTDQTFRLTRRQGLKSGAFYSCDNQTGYLVIVYNDEHLLFSDVEKGDWTAMISSSDPEGYFLDMRREWALIP